MFEEYIHIAFLLPCIWENSPVDVCLGSICLDSDKDEAGNLSEW